ncbi:MAG: hypothetical protein R2883_07290 [Caldisericia bacterium]
MDYLLFGHLCGDQTSLTLLIDQPDAYVFLNGEMLDTPVDGYSLDPGTYNIRVESIGFLPNVFDIEVSEGHNNLFNIKMSTERERIEEINPGVPDHGFRIRSLPDSTESICYIADINSGNINTFDLEETPLTGDWNKILPLAGFEDNTTYSDVVALAICNDDDGRYGVCSIGTESDPILRLSETNWYKAAPKWEYLPRIENKSEKILPNESNATENNFFARKKFDVVVENFISDEGIQSVKVFDNTDEANVLWEGNWALGAFNYIEGDVCALDFIGDDKIAVALCTETGFELAVVALEDGEIISSLEIDEFPNDVVVDEYSGVFGITLIAAGKSAQTFTWSNGLGFAGIPETKNGSFETNIGAWLPAGNDKLELRFPLGIDLSVCFENIDGELVAVWAGIRK